MSDQAVIITEHAELSLTIKYLRHIQYSDTEI